jgi:hypothetical protein
MKRATLVFLTASVYALLVASPGLAQMDPNPNGFLSGEHFNLNIISKKAEYQCSLGEDEFGNPVYGNVIFVPEGQEVKITMQSGKIKGNKLSDLGDTLRVIDPCANFLHDSTDDPAAILQLPPHSAGYRVLARMVGTPSGNAVIQPGLDYLQDDNGNYLYLGDIDSKFECPEKTIDPHVKGSKGKGNTGRSVATEITCLFEWSGEVCYFDPDFTGQVTAVSAKFPTAWERAPNMLTPTAREPISAVRSAVTPLMVRAAKWNALTVKAIALTVRCQSMVTAVSPRHWNR